jgi:hypothetical protein
MMMREHTKHPAVAITPKNLVLALLLATLFGPFGLFYVTVPGAMTMLIVGIALAMFTFGMGFFLVWPLCIIWAAFAVISSNKRARLEAEASSRGKS